MCIRDRVEHGRLVGSKQRVACLKIALGSMHVKGTERPVLCVVVGDLDVQVKAVLQLGIAAIERTVSHRLIGNACYLDRPGYADAEEFQQLIDEEYTTFEDYLKGAGLI